jgi:PST family polysaccharide transporter
LTISTMMRTVDPQRPHLSGILRLLRSNSHLCFTRLVQLFAPMGNTFLLGVISPIAAPSYGAAERTSVATRGLLSPILQVAFPEIVVLYRENPDRARGAVRRILIVLFAGALVLSSILWLVADLVVVILFGPAFASSVPVFRVLLISVPLFAVIQVVGLQWLLPLKHDRAYLASAILGVILNLCLAFALVPEFGAVGMAYALVLSELAVSAGLLSYTEFLGPKGLRILRKGSSIEPRVDEVAF